MSFSFSYSTVNPWPTLTFHITCRWKGAWCFTGSLYPSHSSDVGGTMKAHVGRALKTQFAWCTSQVLPCAGTSAESHGVPGTPVWLGNLLAWNSEHFWGTGGSQGKVSYLLTKSGAILRLLKRRNNGAGRQRHFAIDQNVSCFCFCFLFVLEIELRALTFAKQAL